MLKRYAFSFYEVVTRIEELRQAARTWSGSSAYTSPPKVSAHTLSGLTATLDQMRVECNKLDLSSTTDMVAHIESEVHVKGQNYNHADMLNHLDTLSVLFAKELQKASCFRIANEKDKYFQKDDLFGPDVGRAFGSCIGEIQNAGTCYALEQNDACVFHLMRTLERVLGVLASKFNVSFQQDNWHNIIEQLEARIRRMDTTFGSVLTGKTNRSSMLEQPVNSCSLRMLGAITLCMCVMCSMRAKHAAF